MMRWLNPESESRYKGVRRRSWGKWVSEIRVPGSKERLWLGSYATPEAAAVAHDTAVLLLRGPSSSNSLNFPENVRAACSGCQFGEHGEISPRSVQRVASDAGLAADAKVLGAKSEADTAAFAAMKGGNQGNCNFCGGYVKERDL